MSTATTASASNSIYYEELITLGPQQALARLLKDSPSSSSFCSSLRSFVFYLLHGLSYQSHISLTTWLETLMYRCEPELFYQQLQTWQGSSGKSGVCAYIFKRGEAAYMCRTCGVDPTCIQCMGCFKASNHEGHDTIMAHAGGGGCCDCGDPTSWAREGFCKHHQGPEQKTEIDLSQHLSAPVLAGIAAVIETILLFISITFMHDESSIQSILPCMTLPDTMLDSTIAPSSCTTTTIPQRHGIWLLNDDVHTFRAVIDRIRLATRCSSDEAQLTAYRVHGYERACCWMGTLSQCLSVQECLEGIHLRTQMIAIPNHVVCVRESRRTTLIQWCASLCKASQHFRQIQCSFLSRPLSTYHDAISNIYNNFPLHSATLAISNSPSTSSTSSRTLDRDSPNISPKKARVSTSPYGMEDDTFSFNSASATSISTSTSTSTSTSASTSTSSTPTPTPAAAPVPSCPISYIFNSLSNHIRRANSLTSPRQPDSDTIMTDQKQNEMIPSSSPSLVSTSSSCRPSHTELMIDPWISSNYYVSNSAWQNINALLIQLFIDMPFKQLFTISYAQQYEALVSLYNVFEGDVDHSMLDYTVQLFTIPPMIINVVRDHGLMNILLSTLRGLFTKVIGPNGATIKMSDPNMQRLFVPCQIVLKDLEYVLRCKPVPYYIYTENSDILMEWFSILQLFEGADPYKRQTQFHVPYENKTWKVAFSFALRMSGVCELLIDSFRAFLANDEISESIKDTSCERVLSTCARALTHAFTIDSRGTNGVDTTTWSLAHGDVPLIDTNVDQDYISFHHPVHRLTSQFIVACAMREKGELKHKFPYLIHATVKQPASLFSCSSSSSCTPATLTRAIPLYARAVDHPMRVLSTVGHVRAGIWVLNGDEVLNQVYNYTRSEFTGFQDSDILSLQLSLSFIPSDWFISMLVTRYLLDHYLGVPANPCSAAVTAANARYAQWTAPKVTAACERFLELLISLLTFRCRLGEFSDTQKLRHLLIHRLWVKDCAHSQLSKALPSEFQGHPEFQRVLDSVATFTPPSRSSMGSGIYEIRNECMAEFNPYFMGYTPEQRESAEQNYLEKLKHLQATNKLVDSSLAIYPPVLRHVAFRPAFRDIPLILCTRLMANIWFTLLHHMVVNVPATPQRPQRKMTERLLNHTLYLISMALSECISGNIAPAHQAQLIAHLTLPFESSSIEPQPCVLLYLCKLLKSTSSKPSDALPIQTQHGLNLTCQRPLIEYIIVTSCRLDGQNVCYEMAKQYIQMAPRCVPGTSARELGIAAAKQRRVWILAQFRQMQEAFAAKHADELQADEIAERKEKLEQEHGTGIEYTCVACKSQQRNADLGLIGWIHRSHVTKGIQLPAATPTHPRQRLITRTDIVDTRMDDTSSTSTSSSSDVKQADPSIVSPDAIIEETTSYSTGIQMKFCGHCIHYICLDAHLASMMQHHASGVQYEGMNSILLDQGEFVCPLCKSIGNALVPVTPRDTCTIIPNEIIPSPILQNDEDIPKWLSDSTVAVATTTPTPTTTTCCDSVTRVVQQRQQAHIADLAEKIDKLLHPETNISRFRFRCHPPRSQTAIPDLIALVYQNIISLEIGHRLTSQGYNIKSKEISRRKYKQPATCILRCIQQRQVDGIRVVYDAVRMFVYAEGDIQAQQNRKNQSWGRLIRSFTPQATSASTSTSASTPPLIGLDVDPLDVLLQCAITIPPNAEPSVTSTALQTALLLTYLMQIVKAVGHVCFAHGIDNQHTRARSFRASIIRERSTRQPSPSQLDNHVRGDDWCTHLSPLCALLTQYNECFGTTSSPTQSCCTLRQSDIIALCIPYLRQAAILMRAINESPSTSTSTSTTLSTSASSSTLSQDRASDECEIVKEWNALITTLQLPSIPMDFHMEHASMRLIHTWLKNLSTDPTTATATATATPTPTSTTATASFTLACSSPSTATSATSTSSSSTNCTVSFSFSSSACATSSSTVTPERCTLRGFLNSLSSQFCKAPVPPTTSTSTFTPSTLISPAVPLSLSTSHGLSRLDAFMPFELCLLPDRYDQLFQMTGDEMRGKCSGCNKQPEDPAICLTCGRMLCAANKCCTKEGRGELSLHTEECCPGAGVYLFLRESALILMSDGNAISFGSVYVDRHGELDIGLRRGRSLTLNQQRWTQVQQMAAEHAIPSLVSRLRNQRYTADCPARYLF